jgi:hypothetical protein
MRIPGEIVCVRVAEVDADRLVAVLGFHRGELLADHGERLVPLDLSKIGAPSSSKPRRTTGLRSRSGSSYSCFRVEPFGQMKPLENTSS